MLRAGPTTVAPPHTVCESVLPPQASLPPPVKHAHTRTHAHSQAHAHAHKHARTRAPTQTRPHTHAHSHTRPHTHARTRTPARPHAHARAPARPRAHTIRYEIQDLGSLNGTWINGERLSAERILSEWRTLKGGCVPPCTAEGFASRPTPTAAAEHSGD